MDKKKILILFLLCLVSFLPFFFKYGVNGMDSYYYMGHVCGVEHDKYSVETTPPLFNIVANVLPCNFFVIKLILFVGFFLSVLSIAYLGEVFNSKYGWLAAVFSFLSPILSTEFTKFENDQFGFPILLWATYFFFRGVKEKSIKLQALSVAMVLFACGFWGGGLYYILAFALGSVVAISAAVPVLIFFWKKLIDSALPIEKVVESTPLLGGVALFLLIFGYFFIEMVYLPQLLFFTVLLFVGGPKFAIHVIPLLSVSMAKMYGAGDRNRILKRVARIFLYVAVILALSRGFMLYNSPPTAMDWEMVDSAIEYSTDLNKGLHNGWELGYWVSWRGAEPSRWGGFAKEDLNSMHNRVILTSYDVNCSTLEEFGIYKIYNC
jgi:hypothetical protein